jgi:uncharacterized protein YgiM (DUF1202 family)
MKGSRSPAPTESSIGMTMLTGVSFALAILIGMGAFLVFYAGLQGATPGTVAVVPATPTSTATKGPEVLPTSMAQEEPTKGIPVTPTPSPIYRISAGQRINLRAEPSISADVVTTLAPGDTVTIVGPDKEVEGKTWRNIRDSGGNVGWTWSDFIAGTTGP